jgi:hypothetical protein
VSQPDAALDDVNFSDLLDDYFAECDEPLVGARRLLRVLREGIMRVRLAPVGEIVRRRPATRSSKPKTA